MRKQLQRIIHSQTSIYKVYEKAYSSTYISNIINKYTVYNGTG